MKSFAKSCFLNALGVVRSVPRDSGVLLTFDDGPHPEVTAEVLELLAQYDAKAVFFIVGNRIPKSPPMLAKIHRAGHAIGNHTFEHPLDGNPPLVHYYRDVKACQQVLHLHTGQVPQLFRPPLGSLTAGSLLAPRLLGMRTMLWSVDVGDWQLRNEADAEIAGNRLAENASPGDIVLLHDDNPWVVRVLEIALPKLRKQAVRLDAALGALKARPDAGRPT